GVAQVPAASDAVTISTAVTVTLNVDTPVLSSITIANSGSGTATLDVGTHTLSTGTLTVGGTAKNSTLTIGSGIVNATGNVSFADSKSTILFTGAGTLHVGGSLTTGGTLTGGTGTVDFNGSGAQTSPVATGVT